MLVAQGTVTLTAGSATVNHAHIRPQCKFVLTRLSAFGTIGDLKLDGVPVTGSFGVRSANILDTSLIQWMAFA